MKFKFALGANLNFILVSETEKIQFRFTHSIEVKFALGANLNYILVRQTSKIQ